RREAKQGPYGRREADTPPVDFRRGRQDRVGGLNNSLRGGCVHRARVWTAAVVLGVARQGSSTRADAASTLVARWGMDETWGTVMRCSVGGHDGGRQPGVVGRVGVLGAA